MSNRPLDDVSVTVLIPHTPESVGYSSGEEFLSIATYHDRCCRELAARGADVELVYLGDGPAPGRGEYAVRTMPTTTGSSFGRELSLRLYADLARTDRDILHVQGYNQPNIIPILCALALSDTRVVVQNHGGALDDDSLVHRTWRNILLPLIDISVDHVVSVNDVELKRLERSGVPSSKLKHVPNAVDTDLFTPMSRDRARDSLELEADARYILFVGKITRNKGVSTLVEAFAELPSNTRLLLVYSSAEATELSRVTDFVDRAGINDRVEFVGTVDHEHLPEYYNAADVCAFPSTNEGFGVVVLEAMACGTAVVGTTEHAAAGHLRDGRNGVVVEQDAPSELRDTLRTLLKDDSRRRTLADAGRQAVEREYTWDRVVTELVDVYTDR